MAHFALILEFSFLFIALPVLYRLSPIPIPTLPALWLVTAYAWIQLERDPRFDRSQLWRYPSLAHHLPSILLLFVVSASLIWLGTHLFTPHLEWQFVRRRTTLWALVMIAYPVLSVYPQGMIYRAFFFERYAPLFPARWAMIVASAAAFAFMHLIFRNGLAIALTFAGGLLFAWRYALSGSLLTSSFEHALYGCCLFTVGLGTYFYHGTLRTSGSLFRG